MPQRYALVYGARNEDQLQYFLPQNYRVVGYIGKDEHGMPGYLIVGIDMDNITLEHYVVPRLASGFMRAVVVEADILEKLRKTGGI